MKILSRQIDVLEKLLKKHVVIIGAGPAGMKAAITASDRGHDVTLIEKVIL